MTIHVDTRSYEIAHGTKPGQSRHVKQSPWAFQSDGDTEHTACITASYCEAVRQAKRLATYRITVMP